MISHSVISLVVAQQDRGQYKVPAVWARISKIREHEALTPIELQRGTQTPVNLKVHFRL